MSRSPSSHRASSATARVCASLGAEMVLVDLAGAESVAGAIREAGGAALACVADVSRRPDMDRIAGEVGSINGLILNAAVCPSDEDWQAPEWDQSFNLVMAVNVLGPIHAVRSFLPDMIARRRGPIVL